MMFYRKKDGAKKSKYRNKKVEYEGISFDSKKEMNRYVFLKDMEDKGVIENLERQVRFVLIPSITEDRIVHLKTKDKVVKKTIQLAITYTCDFAYYKDGEYVVEDCKISPKVKPDKYILKNKMMFALKGIRIKEVYNANDPI